ncbi:MAG TPA: dipeptide epimerase [Gemmatimonadaceae bacterium]|nr:dipeptide epimerase [Gemmatimonadaceae bacterium]
MKLLQDRFTIHPKVPFAIARGTMTAYDRVRVRLIDDAGVEGWGEAAPNTFYHETADTAAAALAGIAPLIERRATVDSLEAIDSLEEQMRATVGGQAAARSAVSAAAHDLLGKKRREPLWKMFGVEPMMAPPSSFTIVITNDERELLRRVDEARSYPILKVKLGSDRDEWIVRTVRRAAPRKLLRADANAAWDPPTATRMARLLAENGFELLEQPLAKDDIEGHRVLTAASPIPIIADESCLTASDIARVDGAFHGINIKLAKCGGLAEARRMAHEARRHDLKVMLGCMVESSLGITAAAHLAPLVDYADLDGAALLADDPYVGVTIDDGLIRLSAEPGLGVRIRA